MIDLTRLTPTENATPSKMHNAPQIKHSVIINKSPAEVYALFRDFKNLPQFMKNLKSVEYKSAKNSHWKVELSNGYTAEWDAEIIADLPGELISWKSTGYSQVDQAGSIWFLKTSDLKTIVRLHLSYRLPLGKFGEFATKLVGGDPDYLILANLHRLKDHLEDTNQEDL